MKTMENKQQDMKQLTKLYNISDKRKYLLRIRNLIDKQEYD